MQRQTDLEDLDIGYQEIGIDVIQKRLRFNDASWTFDTSTC